MVSLKNTALLIVFMALAGLYSCTQHGMLSVTEDADSRFSIIVLKDALGNDITFQPVSSETGSIGYEKNGNIIWLKGTPSLTKTENEEVYEWKAEDGNKIVMTLTTEGGNVDFKLSLVATDGSHLQKWYLNLKATPDEYFTGIFERVIDGKQTESWKDGISTAMNLRGEKIDMKLKPTVSAYAPFYISSANYGFFVHGTWPGIFDFCKENEDIVQISFEDPELSFKIYKGDSPASVIKQHALETGPSVIPPDWALGPWRWRDEHRNNETYYDGTKVNAPYNSELVEDVLMMEAFDIPCSAQWIDRPWCPGSRGFDDYEFDTLRLPQPENMIKWLNSKGIELMMWIGPFVMGEMADYAEEKGYNLESKQWKNSRQVLMDFTNEEACKWWGEHGPGKLARMGIKGYKLDRADGEKLTDSLHLKTSIGTTYRENYNDFPRQYVKATDDAVRAVLGDDCILFPRSQYTGSAKHGGMWAGDTNGKPEGLRSAVIAMQRCAVMGYPIWGSDIGGYWGQFSNETCMRWLGFGCFSPLMEVGPTNNKGLWDNPDEPKYDTLLIATWRLYSKIRMKLVPYIKELAKEASETGMPVARPLFIEYPEQEEAWKAWQTYLLGSDILVSVIWEKGKTKHKVYLPAGQEWIDAWDTSNVIKGGQYVEVEAPLYKTPVFIREGAGIDLGDLNKLYKESLEIAAKQPNLQELEAKEGWK